MVARIVIGNRSGTDYGLWISRDGINALTNTNPENFHVYNNTLAIHVFMSGTVSSTVNVTHNLGYIPLIQTSPSQWDQNLTYRAFVTTTQVQFNNANNRTISYVIYRTPLVPNYP